MHLGDSSAALQNVRNKFSESKLLPLVETIPIGNEIDTTQFERGCAFVSHEEPRANLDWRQECISLE